MRNWIFNTTACAVAALLWATGAASAQIAVVGVDFDAGQGSPINWNPFTGSTPGTLFNLIDENGSVTNYNFTLNHGSKFSGNANAATVPNHWNPLNLIGDYYFGTGVGTAKFSNLTAGAPYHVWVFGLRAFDMNNRITIHGGGAPIMFDQIGPSGQLWVNGSVGDSSLDLIDFAVIQTADASGAISFSFDIVPGGQAGWTIAGVAIHLVPSPGALALLGLAGLAGVRRRRRE